MLIIRFGKIVEYANSNQTWLKKSVEEFFDNKVDIDKYDHKILSGLFNEWFIFDFHPTVSEATPVNQYYFKNPNNLPETQIKELEQIIKTEYYSMYQIKEVKKGEWLNLVDVFSGKSYKVFDIKGSSNTNDKGTLAGRLAKVDGKWIVAGSDPLYFPITYTKRSLNFFSRTKDSTKLNPKYIFDQFIKNQKEEKPEEDIKVKVFRKELGRQYKSMIKKYKLKTDFEKLLDFVYSENYENHFAQFFKDLSVKLKIPEKVIFENLNFFQNIWNYFPHEVLNGLCPNEMYRRYDK